MTPSAISAVIPTYNRAALVGRAIESVLRQEVAADEIIVVDDGSVDATEAVVARYTGVRYVRQPNAGGAAARNRGVREARNRWIGFLDSDDVWVPGHLAAMGAAIEETAGTAAVYFGDTIRTADEGGRRLWHLAGLSPALPFELRGDATEWAMMPRQPMMLQSSVFDREAYLRVGGLDASLTRRHDTHLFLILGIGHAACAVSGAAARMTSDDSSGGRLIQAHDASSRVYWECTVRLYSDVLARRGGAPRWVRAELRRRLALAHWRLARLSWDDHDRVGAIRRLAVSTATSPRTVISQGASKLRSGTG